MPPATMAMHDRDEALSGDLSARLRAARDQLRTQMRAAGCHDHDGWRIHEELTNSPTGTQFVLRPVHRLHPTPEGMTIAIPVTA
jgi:hypothetical protein